MIVAAYVGRRIVHWLEVALERRYRVRVQDVHIQAFQIVTAEQVWRFLSGFLNLVWGLAVLATAYVYLRYVLALFPWTREAGNRLYTIAIDPLRSMGQAGSAASFSPMLSALALRAD